jgi:hypothetical protein
MRLPFGAVSILACALAGAASAQTAPAAAGSAPLPNTAPVKSVGAQAQSKATANSLTCSDFQRNPDGVWTPSHVLTLRRPGLSVTLKPGEVFGAGTTIIGLPLADMLDKQC